MRHRPTHAAVRFALTALLLAATACGTSDPGRSATDPGGSGPGGSGPDGGGPAADELAAGDGRPCPTRLPGTGDDVFGSTDPAGSAPDLPAPDRAWVCTYRLADAWTREGRPQPVPADRLPALAAALDALVPAAGDRVCTEELGPRHLVVLADDAGSGTDLTGVAVDAFGCRDVRLTDDPRTTPPGEPTASGVVPGVLTGPEGLLAALGPGAAAGR